MEKKKAYVVATAHLDTVWRWELAKTIEEFIPDTLAKNFELLEKYPNYRFNFEGAYRYEIIEQYYPRAFEIIKEYVEQGRWCISGTAYESGDVNIPSPESIFRNLLIGHRYFMTRFGKSSKDVFLPDCFGFGAALPSIISHAGLKGFTTQKLSWGCANGLPFDIGRWKGLDGSEIYTCLNARSYRYKFSGDVRGDLSIINRIADNAGNAQLPWANHLYGTGDWGGAPTEESVKSVNDSVEANKNNPDFEVISASSDQVFEDLDKLSKAEKAKLPEWNNELVMTSHGAGAYTSRAMSKRLNKQNEIMADMAEKACVFANCIGCYRYPKELFNVAWKRVVRHQFHDDITGTSNMEVYNQSWNDYYLSLSQFKHEYMAATRGIIDEFDTSWADTNSNVVIVNNATQFKRKGLVEITIRSRINCSNVAVFDKTGKEVPSQICSKLGKKLTIAFIAEIDPFGYRVYEIKKAEKPCSIETGVKATNHSLENKRYKLIFNKNGDIAYLYDKKLGRQIIDAPIKMALLHDTGSLAYPSWEIRKEDLDKEPYCYANTPVFTVVENGPVRAKIRVVREAEYSTISQTVTLSAESDIVKVDNVVDWKTRRTMLKAVFPLAAHNEIASYDLGIGVIKRGNNTENLYEVPAQNWADITDKSGDFGVSILSECKYGWDKPNDNTLRLSCIHTPVGAFTKDARQDLQDLGRNIFSYAIYSHEGGFENGTQMQSDLFNHPMLAVQTEDRNKRSLTDHESFCTVSNNNALVKAIKYSEDINDDIIIRVSEGNGTGCRNVTLKTFAELEGAFLNTALEEEIKPINLYNGGIKFNLKPFETKTFRLRRKKFDPIPKERYITLAVPYNSYGFTTDENMRNIIMQGSGFSLPKELIGTQECWIGGVRFRYGRQDFTPADVCGDVMICRGQEIDIPQSDHNNCTFAPTRMFFVAGSVMGPQEIKLKIGKKQVPFNIKPIDEPISRWDMAGLNQSASVNQNDVPAIVFSHTHHPEGNTPKSACFYMYSLNITGYDKVIFPENNKVIVLAITVVSEYTKSALSSNIEDVVSKDYDFNKDIPPIDKLLDKTDAITIRAGKIQDQINGGKGKGFKRDNIITNIIRSYTKSEW